MKKIVLVLSIGFILAGTLPAQNRWFVNALSGDDQTNNGFTPTTAKKTISGVIASGLLHDNDTINIGAGTYSDHPTIPKNIVINGYTVGLSTDIMVDCTGGSIVFSMSGRTKFTLNNVPAFGLAGAGRFYFYGSDTSGIRFQSGDVELATATFQFEAPFLFQTNHPPQTYTPSTWYVDFVSGNNELNTGYGLSDARQSITGVAMLNQWLDGDCINIAAASYNDGPVITKNITINGYIANGFTDVEFKLDSTNLKFQMTGRTDFTTYPVGPGLGAFRFYFTGSRNTGIYFKSGCVHLTNATFYMLPPFLIMSPLTANGISENRNMPVRFDLRQAYPNPFNPSTTIRFSVHAAGKTTLKVFDPLGKQVSVLVDEMLQPGTYERTFNAGNLSSGVYFYRLQSGTSTLTKKLVLLR